MIASVCDELTFAPYKLHTFGYGVRAGASGATQERRMQSVTGAVGSCGGGVGQSTLTTLQPSVARQRSSHARREVVPCCAM